MPSDWPDYGDYSDENVIDSMFEELGARTELQDDDCNQYYAANDDSCMADVAPSVECAGRQPMCSTPDAKRRKLAVDVGVVQQQKALNAAGMRIKRPMNAFMIWSQIERRKMADTEPNLHNSVISRVLGQRWQKMSNGERQPFVREADLVRQVHLKEHPDYRYCPRRKEKRKPGDRRSNIRQQPVAATVRDVCQVRESALPSKVHSLQNAQSSQSSADTPSSDKQPIRCFRATLGQSPSSAIDKYSFLSSYSVSSSGKDNLRLKLTIDRSFKEKLKQTKHRRLSSSSLKALQPHLVCADDHSSASALSTDDSGWGSSSNSGSCSTSECNTSMTDSDLTLDDVLSSIATHETNATITAQQPDADNGSTDNFNSLFVLPDFLLNGGEQMGNNDELNTLQVWDLVDLPSGSQFDITSPGMPFNASDFLQF